MATVTTLPFCLSSSFFFFFNDTATTEIYTLSLHDALPISAAWCTDVPRNDSVVAWSPRSEEHTSELQSRFDLVCRLLLEKKKQILLPLPAQKTNDETHDPPGILVAG